MSTTTLSPAAQGAAEEKKPFLELRIGGVHLTVQHVPYRLLTLIATLSGALGGVTWLR
ncbi:hypothetical protein [Streptomyces sp. NPDC055134]